MDRKKTSNHYGHLNRRSFLDAAGRLAGGGLAVGATFETKRPSSASGQQPAKAAGDQRLIVNDQQDAQCT